MIILLVIVLAIAAYAFDALRSKPKGNQKDTSKSAAKSKVTKATEEEPKPVVRQRARPKKVLSEAEKEKIRQEKQARLEREEREYKVRSFETLSKLTETPSTTVNRQRLLRPKLRLLNIDVVRMKRPRRR